jgi:hypothetical protein
MNEEQYAAETNGGTFLAVMAEILALGTDRGVAQCPKCKGKLSWVVIGKTRRARALGLRGKCETPGCVEFMS